MQTIATLGFSGSELKRFTDLFINIGRFMTLRDPLIGPTASESHFSSSQIHALISCGTDGQLTMGELARRTCITEKTITGIVDRLERDGLVQRLRDPSDRRVIRVALTDKGTEQFKVFEQTMQRRFAGFLSLLEEADRRALYDILEKVLKRVREQSISSGGSKEKHR